MQPLNTTIKLHISWPKMYDWHNRHRHSPGFFFPTRAQFLQSCLPQEFPFPMTMIKYVWMNPSSSKVYQKLIQCCKLFFIKNPILVFDDLYYQENKYAYGWEYKDAKTDKFERVDETFQCNIWLAQKFMIQSDILTPIASDVKPKIVHYDVEDLSLHKQKLTYDELKFFTSGVKKCHFGYNHIKYDNGKSVPLENVLQLFSNCEKIDVYSHDATCESYVALADACQNIKKVYLQIQNEFDFVGFYQYSKKIKNRSVICLSLSNQIQGIDDIVDEILQTDSFDFVPPLFWDIGGHERWNKIQQIQKEVAKKLCLL